MINNINVTNHNSKDMLEHLILAQHYLASTQVKL